MFQEGSVSGWVMDGLAVDFGFWLLRSSVVEQTLEQEAHPEMLALGSVIHCYVAQ